MTPKVSIVVPVYNVEKYLADCLDSLVCQSLQNIEIVIVNDGSTDDSLSIAENYAKKDDRIIVISKENSGYGHTMNRGFEKARGEYIGIVESDDCARREMFEKLYEQARNNNADVVRSNYYTMAEQGTKFNLIDVLNLAQAPYCVAFDPQDYPSVLRGSPAIWTGIYKASFIRENGISFLESPGASYQDTGFMLKVLTVAEKVVLMRNAFLNYRIDNEASSVKSGEKVFCVSDEYLSFEKFLAHYPEKANSFRFMIPTKKFETYLWNYNRLDESLRPSFLELMSSEFSEAEQKGNLSKELFDQVEWDEIRAVIDSPESFGERIFSVVPANLDLLEHEKTLRANGEVSSLNFFIWRLKRAFGMA